MNLLINFLKNNAGFISLLFIGIFVLVSLLSPSFVETSDKTINQPPLSAPTSPVSSPETNPPIVEEPFSLEEEVEVVEADDLEILLSDRAADAAMTVLGVGFGIEYNVNPEDRLSRIRPLTNTEVYNYFVRYYNSIDWAVANRQKIEIFADIEEINFLSYNSANKADIEVKVKYYGDDDKTIRNKDEEWFVVEVTRAAGFDGWLVTGIQERP